MHGNIVFYLFQYAAVAASQWRQDIEAVRCVMSVYIKEPYVVKISVALHYAVFHNHVVVFGRKTPEINQTNPFEYFKDFKCNIE